MPSYLSSCPAAQSIGLITLGIGATRIMVMETLIITMIVIVMITITAAMTGIATPTANTIDPTSSGMNGMMRMIVPPLKNQMAALYRIGFCNSESSQLTVCHIRNSRCV